MTQEEKIRIHRLRKAKMVQLAKEFATELHELCKKYNSNLSPYYAFSIDSSDDNSGLTFNCVNNLCLLDLYYAENGNPVIDLNEQELQVENSLQQICTVI